MFMLCRKLNVCTFDAVPGREVRPWFAISTSKVLEVRGRYAQWNLLRRSTTTTAVENRTTTTAPAPTDPFVAGGAARRPPLTLRGEEFVQAGIDTYSYLHHTVPQLHGPNDVLYAVANTLVISERGDKQYMLCDQVTLLPFPEQWLTNALACVDAKWKAYAQPSGAPQLFSTVRLANAIHARLLERARSDIVAYDGDLVQRVLALHYATKKL